MLGRTGFVGPTPFAGAAIIIDGLFRQIIAGRRGPRAVIVILLVGVVVVVAGHPRIVFGDDGFADIVAVDVFWVTELTADFFFCFSLASAEAELFFTVFNNAF